MAELVSQQCCQDSAGGLTAVTQQGKKPVLQDNRAGKQNSGQLSIGANKSMDLPLQRNNTGLPDKLKSGLENLSGYSMDNVKVHYNSSKPAQFQAHAYAQGTDIHLASGQEKHLPHEAWHIVQQAQGRVKPTMQMNQISVNDDQGLETEADIMGSKAMNYQISENQHQAHSMAGIIQGKANGQLGIIQAKWIEYSQDELVWDKSRSGLIWYYNTKTRTMRFESDHTTDLGELDDREGQSQSYRAWIKEWKDRKFIDKMEAHSLSFADYINHIIEIYPPDQFDYVGVGASTDLVLGYMKTKYGIESANIPISGVTNVSIETGEWDAEQRKLVTNYIEAFIPKSVINGDKGILLMDVTSGGTTLNVMEQLLKRIIRDNDGDPRRVRSFSLNTTMKPNRSFFASTDPDVLSKPVPMNPEDVVKRKPSKSELSSGFLPAGTVVDQDQVMLDLDEEEKILERIKLLKREYRKLDKVKDKERRGQIKLEVKRLEGEMEKMEYYPKSFDMMISDTTDIEDSLDSQDYKKKLGRSHRKVNIKDIMSGKTNAEIEKEVGDDENNIQVFVDQMLEYGEE